MPREVGEYFCFTDLKSELSKCGDFSWFYFEIGYALFRALEGGERGALVDISMDSRYLYKNSIAAALRRPTSQTNGNQIDLSVKRYRILNSF
jgi:hypothetical protein